MNAKKKKLYRVPMTLTWNVEVTVSADSPLQAREIAESGGSEWLEEFQQELIDWEARGDGIKVTED